MNITNFQSFVNMDEIKIISCEMHCGGEPVRIIESGYPDIPTDTILNMRTYVKENLDQYRKMLMLEPRGHNDMYGALLLKTTNQTKLDSSVLFMHNFGWSPMCGHATIALARYFVDKQQNSEADKDEIEVRLEVPCGIVQAFVGVKDTDQLKKGEVRFISVEAYVAYQNVQLQLSDNLSLSVDIAYGGGYYAIVPIKSVNIKFGETPWNDIINIAAKIKKKVNETIKIEHPMYKELSFLYGIIFTDDTNLKGIPARSTVNVTVFADVQIDRSPTGSGVTARMALLHKQGLVSLNEKITFISGVNNSEFVGEVVHELEWCERECCKVQVKGKAYYTGRSEFIYERDDLLAFGFRI